MAEHDFAQHLTRRRIAEERRAVRRRPPQPGSALRLALFFLSGAMSQTQAAEAVGVDSTDTIEDAVAIAPRTFYVEEIKAATQAHIRQRLDAEGSFRIHDPVTDKTLTLRFVKVHDPVRRIDGNTYFACTDFEVVGQPGQLYDLDFWLKPGDDQLKVTDEKIHKEPRHALLYGWYKHPRYTFVDDQIVPLYED